MLLSDVCLSVAYIGPKSRTEALEDPSWHRIGSDTTFKVKGQGHQAALLTAVLARRVKRLQRWA